WVRVGHVQAGNPGPTDREDHHQLFTAGGEWNYWYGGLRAAPGGNTYVIDEKQSPPTIDLLLGRAGADSYRGIYKVEGDTLTLCLLRSGERPKTFESSAEAPTTVWVFKRVKTKD